ncbi:MAG: hypothetical protein GY754_25165 [bacterium]|nr:hypothetical protein [bacterium]
MNSKTNKLTLFLLSLFLVTGITACSGGGDGYIPADPSGSEAKANEGFDKLGPLVNSIYDTAKGHTDNYTWDQVTSGDKLLIYSDFSDMKKCFTDSIEKDAGNPKGNLGMALVELAELNYDADLWNNLINPIKDGNYDVTSTYIQTLVKTNAKVRLEKALAHMNKAVNLADTETIVLKDNNGERTHVKKPEVYVIKSAIQTTLALVKVFLAYDFYAVDSEGSFKWFREEIFFDYDQYYLLPVSWGLPRNEWDNPDTDDTWWDNRQFAGLCLSGQETTVEGKQVLTLTRSEYFGINDRENDIQKFSILESNLGKNNFLKIQPGQELPGALNNLNGALDDLLNAYNSLINSSGNQSKNILKKKHIEDINKEINDWMSENADNNDLPDSLKNCKTLGAIISWTKNTLNNGETFTVNGETFSVNLNSFFNGNISDLKTLIPYFNWKAKEDWVEPELSYSYDVDFDPAKTTIWGIFTDKLAIPASYEETANISKVVYNHYDYNVKPWELLDSDEGAPLPDGEWAVLPDYSLGGIFTGISKDNFRTIVEEIDFSIITDLIDEID